MVTSLVLFLFIQIAFAGSCSWERCNSWSKEKDVINVHLIPHTHDDLGWIKTVDQYYWGSKPDLVPVGVQYIYNTVIDELEKNPNRKFSFAETGFLMRWMSSHGDADRHRLQKLVKNGQIEFIGGGWVQNDEAASHYVDIIDQMTLGLHKLETFFGTCGKPLTAWQIDPFGHSREMANLFSMMGYQSLFFARIHYLEKQQRLQNKSLEFIWNASDDLKTQILTGAFFQDNYGPPPGFCWDAMCGDDPIQDNPEMDEYNVDQKLAAFVKHVRNQAAQQRTNHVMLLMGSDFQYTNANMWYENMDKLIKYVMGNSSLNVNVFYSTPTCYVSAITQAQPHLPTKSDDFFPYASSEHSYWTGYFSSRPALKGMIREASALLQLAKQLDSQFFLGPSDDSDVGILAKACALVQHHDAITGTAKENVTRDYEKRLSKGMREVETVINDALAKAAPKKADSSLPPRNQMCLTLNETICNASRSFATFTVTAFNALAQNRPAVVSIPFYSRTALVVDENGTKIESQLTKTFQIPSLASADRAPFVLNIPVEIGPLGYTTYFVDNSSSIRSVHVKHPVKINSIANEVVTIENEHVSVVFDTNGFLASVLTKNDNKTYPLRQEFFYYEGVNMTSDQPSGAYIFRPSQPNAIPFGKSIKLEVVKGPLIQEVRQVISPWVYQTIRLSRNERHIEFDWVVGPIPKEELDPITKELVTRYSSDVNSNDVFYTDANGRQMMKRRVNNNPSFAYEDTEPVSGNYYPITNRVFIKDSDKQMTILTDRSQGATSRHGTVEIMLHRRCFADDHWGVEEPLDEPGNDGNGLVVRGKHWMLIGPSKNAANIHRPLAARMFNSPVLSFAPVSSISDYRKKFATKYSGLTRSLPDFVNLMTLEKRSGTDLLFRVEHLFQNEEDDKNSKPMTIDIKDLFTRFNVKDMHELTLGGNRNWTTNSSQMRKQNDFHIQLRPQDIKTYLLSVDEKSAF